MAGEHRITASLGEEVDRATLDDVAKRLGSRPGVTYVVVGDMYFTARSFGSQTIGARDNPRVDVSVWGNLNGAEAKAYVEEAIDDETGFFDGIVNTVSHEIDSGFASLPAAGGEALDAVGSALSATAEAAGEVVSAGAKGLGFGSFKGLLITVAVIAGVAVLIFICVKSGAVKAIVPTGAPA